MNITPNDMSPVRRANSSSSPFLQIDPSTSPILSPTNEEIQEIFRSQEKEFEADGKKEGMLPRLSTITPKKKTSWVNKPVSMTDLSQPSFSKGPIITERRESPLRYESPINRTTSLQNYPAQESQWLPIPSKNSRVDFVTSEKELLRDVSKLKLNLKKITETPEKKEKTSSFIKDILRPFSPSRSTQVVYINSDSPNKGKEPVREGSTDTSITNSEIFPKSRVSEDKRHKYDKTIREKIEILLTEELKSVPSIQEEVSNVISSDETLFKDNENIYKRITNRVRIVLHYLSGLSETSDFVEKLKNYIVLFVEPKKSQLEKISSHQEGYTKVTLFIQYYDEYLNWKDHQLHDEHVFDICIQIIGFSHYKKDADAVVELLRKWDEWLLMDLENPDVDYGGTPGKSISPGRTFLNLERRTLIKEGLFEQGDFDKKFFTNFKERVSKCYCVTPEGGLLKQAGINFIILNVQKFFEDIPDPHNITIGESMALASPRAQYILDEILSGIILRPLWRRFKLADRYLYSYMKNKMGTTTSINKLLSLITDFISCERYSLPLRGNKINRVTSFLNLFEKEINTKDKSQPRDKKILEAIGMIIGGSIKGTEEVIETLRYFQNMTVKKLIDMLQLESWNKAAASMIHGKLTKWYESSQPEFPIDQIPLKEYLRSFFGSEANPESRMLSSNYINFEKLTVNGVSLELTGYEGLVPVEAQMKFFTSLFTLMYQKMGILSYDQEISSELVSEFVIGKLVNNVHNRTLPTNLKSLLVIATNGLWGHHPFAETYPDLSGRDYLVRAKNGITVDWWIKDGRFSGSQTRTVCVYPKLKPEEENSYAIDDSRPLAYLTLEWTCFKRARYSGGELIWHGIEKLSNLVFTEFANLADISQICHALHITENIRGDKKAEDPTTWPQTLHSPRESDEVSLTPIYRFGTSILKTVKIKEPIKAFDIKEKERTHSFDLNKKGLHFSPSIEQFPNIEAPPNILITSITASSSNEDRKNEQPKKRKSLITRDAI